MKKKHWILLTLGGATTTLVPLVAIQCNKENKTEDEKKNPELGSNPIETPVVVTPTKKVKTISLVATKASELNALAKTLDTESKAFMNDDSYTDIALNYNIKISDKFTLVKQVEYTKDEFKVLLEKMNSKTIDTNLDLGQLLIEVNNQEDLTNAEKALESAYNNYYVNEEWFTKTIKEMIKNAGGSLMGSVTLENAVKKGKTAEYNALVNEIKSFMAANGNVHLAQDLEIAKIDQDLNKGWSLTITLKKDNLVAEGIKLDFRKPRKDWSDADILVKNKEDSKFAKVKSAVANKTLEYKLLIAGLYKVGDVVLKQITNTLIEVVIFASLKNILPLPLNIICTYIMAKPIIKYLNNLADQLIEIYYPKTKLS
ncbi:hypothetical protein ACNQ17_02765 [Mycoplasma sp. Sp48II]|uniref:hypothetical protein n=1 Tax=Mycoplasma sp. Sp48II TaxID=3401682 RepID=UPI003AAF05DF